MSDLLPHNATAQERALSNTTARAAKVPVRVREVWNPDTCPAHVLPWLAWALSVDLWDPAWPEAQKRAAIRTAIAVQQKKGTIGAVRAALGAVSIDARVLEWHRQQVPGSPYTYKLLIEAGPGSPSASLAALDQAVAAIDRTKSLRSHLDSAHVSTSSHAGPFVAAAAGVGSVVAVQYGGQLI